MSQINTGNLGDATGATSTPIEDVINGSARAWVNFNGTGAVAIRADYNVDSITDNGTGDYTINFTNDMPDANYSCVISSGESAVNTNTSVVTQLDASVRVNVNNIGSTASLADSDINNVAVFR